MPDSNEHVAIMTHLTTIIKSTDEMKENLRLLNGKVYSHEQKKADRAELIAAQANLVSHIKSIETNSKEEQKQLYKSIIQTNIKVDSNTSKIWKMSLFLAGGIAGGFGANELIKIFFGG